MKTKMSEQKNIEIKNCPIEVANDIWNAAIEAAALKMDEHQFQISAALIRQLKK